jgi:hypothetical protein
MRKETAMKLQITALAALSLISTLTSTAFANEAPPTNSNFGAVYDISKNIGYESGNPVICVSARNNMVLGGTHAQDFHGVSPLQIFFVNGNGNVTKTLRPSAINEFEGTHQFVTEKGEQVTLNIGPGEEVKTSDHTLYLTRHEANVTVGPREIAQLITCYLSHSLLE